MRREQSSSRRPRSARCGRTLFWAAIYNLVAIPIAAGLYPAFGILLRPEFGALAHVGPDITVALNALLLWRELPSPA